MDQAAERDRRLGEFPMVFLDSMQIQNSDTAEGESGVTVTIAGLSTTTGANGRYSITIPDNLWNQSGDIVLSKAGFHNTYYRFNPLSTMGARLYIDPDYYSLQDRNKPLQAASTTTFQLGFYSPPVLMTESDDVKASAPLMSAVRFEISDATLYHEIVRARVDWKGGPLSSDTPITVRWYNADTATKLFEYSYVFKAGWTYAFTYSWIGHLPAGEIDRAGNYYVEFISSLWTTHRLDFIITKAPPAIVYKVLPVPPADFPAKFLPYYKELDDALAAKDTVKVLGILTTHMWEEGSPIIFLGFILSIPTIVGAIVAVIGSYGFAGFLIEEALQTIDMAIYTASQNKEYDLAQTALNKKKEILNPTLLQNVLAAIPLVNVLEALKVFYAASDAKMVIDKEILNRKMTALIRPEAWDTTSFINAFDKGLDTTPFMPKRFSILEIDPNVSGGDVIINGLGWSVIFPFSIEVAPGTYTVETSSPGYETVTDIVQVEPYTIKVHKPFLTKLPEEVTKGSLEVISTPDKANIFLNGSLYTYPTNAVISNLDPGSYTVEIRKTGYTSVTKTVDIVANQRSTINVALIEVVPPEILKGSLEVISTPDGADIFVNGSLYTYPTNAVISKLVPGSYSIEIRKTGYTSVAKTVNIIAGQRSSVNVILTSEIVPPTEWPAQLAKEVVVTMEKTPTTYNAWKYTLKTVEKTTGAPLPAKIYINGEDTGKWTPYYFYLEPVTTYVLRFERWGYVPVEKTEITEALSA
jgi:hypothetical protein